MKNAWRGSNDFTRAAQLFQETYKPLSAFAVSPGRDANHYSIAEIENIAAICKSFVQRQRFFKSRREIRRENGGFASPRRRSRTQQDRAVREDNRWILDEYRIGEIF